MKKIIGALLGINLMFLGACGQDSSNPREAEKAINEEEGLREDKIYFFYAMGCPHCHDALEYIKAKYPNLAMESKNVASRDGYELFLECADKFDLGNQIGTPLFCMGKSYIMGWGKSSGAQFDEQVKPYIK